MVRGLRWGMLVAALGGLVFVAPSTAGPTAAWSDYAPAPLASDSSFAALRARTPDSLTKDERWWVRLQESWRDERLLEQTRMNARGSITEAPYRHDPDATDAEFAGLMNRPYEQLGPLGLARLRDISEHRHAKGVGRGVIVGVVVVVLTAGIVAAGIGASMQDSMM